MSSTETDVKGKKRRKRDKEEEDSSGAETLEVVESNSSSRALSGSTTIKTATHTVGFEYEIDDWKIWADTDLESKEVLLAFGDVEGAPLVKLEPDGDHAEIISNALRSPEEIKSAVAGIGLIAAMVEGGTKYPLPRAKQYFWSIKTERGSGNRAAVHITVALPLELFPDLLQCQDPPVEPSSDSIESCRKATEDLVRPKAKGFCWLVQYYVDSLEDVSPREKDGPKAYISALSRFDFATMFASLGADDQAEVVQWLGLKSGWEGATPASSSDVAGLFGAIQDLDLAPLCHRGFYNGVFQIPAILCPSRLLWLYSIVAPDQAFAVFEAEVKALFDGVKKKSIVFPAKWPFLRKTTPLFLEQPLRVDYPNDDWWFLQNPSDLAVKGGPTWADLRREWQRLEQVWNSLTENGTKDFTYLSAQHVRGKDLCSPLPWFEYSNKLPYAMGCYPKAQAEYRDDKSAQGIFLFEVRSIGFKGGTRHPISPGVLQATLLKLFALINANPIAESSKKKQKVRIGQAKVQEKGRLFLDKRNFPERVEHGGVTYIAANVQDAGNCFYESCALMLWGDASRYMEMRGLLSQSAHLKNPGTNWQRVSTDGEYATTDDIQAMAKELGITIKLHECQYGEEETECHEVVGGSNGTLNLLFQFMPDGTGHIQPLT